MTREDLLKRNVDLLARAGQLLAGAPERDMTAALDLTHVNDVVLNIETKGMTRVDVCSDDRPLLSEESRQWAETAGGLASAAGRRTLELRGFADAQLVARWRIEVPAEPVPRAARFGAPIFRRANGHREDAA